MSNYADTGNQATISFATTGFTGRFHMIGSTEQEIADLEDSHLGTTDFKTYFPSDLAEPGEFEIEFEWQGDDTPPALGTIETITVTHPVPPGMSNGAVHAGTGYVKKVAYPELRNGAIQVGKATVRWDGKTGPAYTPAT